MEDVVEVHNSCYGYEAFATGASAALLRDCLMTYNTDRRGHLNKKNANLFFIVCLNMKIEIFFTEIYIVGGRKMH